MDIITVKELREAVKTADIVVAQVRFGASEAWVKIPKKEVYSELLAGLEEDENPTDYEYWTGVFGTLKDGVLYLG